MITLNQVKQILTSKIFSKKNIFLGALIILVIILAIILTKKIITQITPQPPKITISSPIKNNFTVKKFSFTAKLNLPQKADILNLKKESVFNLDVAKKIAKNLGFEKAPVARNDPVLKLFFEWKENNYLAYYPLDEKIVYYLNIQKNPRILTQGEKPTEASAQEKAIEFLKSLSLWNPNFKILKTFKLNNLGTELTQTTSQEVNVIEFWYGLFWQEQPVLTNIPDEPWVKIQVARDSQITRFEYKNPPQIQNSQGQYLTLKSDQILELLDNGQGTLVSFDFGGTLEKPLSTNTIEEMKIENSKLAYLSQTENQNFLAPIFVLEGKITTTDQTTGQATVYLPAILQETVKK